MRPVTADETAGWRLAMAFELAGRSWAIDVDKLEALADLDGVQLGGAISSDALASAVAARKTTPRAGSISVLPLKGTLFPGGDLLSFLFGFGGDPLQTFRDGLAQALGDPEVEAVVIDIDSPGGVVDQIPETAREIRQARKAKPIVAVANGQADSAAYWLASQASEIVVTDSGETGSIGVYQLHRDLSGRYAQDGVKPTLISAGRYKVEGNPYEPLDDEAAAAIQADVDDYYTMFVKDVAKGRGVTANAVRNGFGEGRALHAQQSVDAGLADRVDTLPATVRRLATAQGRNAIVERQAAADEPPVSAVVSYTPDERRRLLAVLAD
jgi:signal peptide peptidase SppA